MSDPYWEIVKPVWDTISIQYGEEIFLEQYNKATEKQRVLYSSHWAQSEILNGGLGQFFSNSTGVLAPEAVDAFNKLGMPKCARAITGAMRFFGNEYSRDHLLREKYFERFFEESGEDGIPFEEYEDLIADLIEEENGGFWKAANDYAIQV